MLLAGALVSRVSDLVDGQEAVCFAALVRKSRGVTKSNKPYLKCVFRDKRIEVESAAPGTIAGATRKPIRGLKSNAYRLHVQCRHDVRIRPAARHILSGPPRHRTPVPRGRRLRLFRPGAQQQDSRRRASREARRADRSLDRPDAALKTLVRNILAENHAALCTHAGGAEHAPFPTRRGCSSTCGSMTRIASFLAEHLREVLRRSRPATEPRLDCRGRDSARYRQAS